MRGPEVYVVRFLSCVALHAVWTGSVGLTLHRRRAWFEGAERWYQYGFAVVRTVAVPMVLHGLYDTLLKKGMSGWALAVAGVSFLYLAYQVERQRGEEKGRVASLA
jgi:hypothetical protein